VGHAGTIDDARRHAGDFEATRVLATVVAQNVRGRQCDDRRRQVRQMRRRERRELRGVRCGAGAIEIPVLRHLRSAQAVALGEIAIRRARARGIERGIEQQLQVRLRRALRAQTQCQRRGKVATGAVSGDGETLAVRPERASFRTGPAPRGFDVVERGRIDVFRRTAIVDGHDDCAEPVGENPAKLVV